MNKKKVASVVLALSLMVGAGAYGTYAYFTDSAKTSSTVVVKVGNLKVGTDDASSKWTYVAQDGKTNDTIDFKEASDLNALTVRPGDTFSKTVTITNNGSLTQDLLVEKNLTLPAGSPWAFTIEPTSKEFSKTDTTCTFHDVKPGDKVIFNMKLVLDGATTGNTDDSKNPSYKYNVEDVTTSAANLDLTHAFITVTATQPNAR